VKCGHCPLAGRCFGEIQPAACECGDAKASDLQKRFLEARSAAMEGRVDPPRPSVSEFFAKLDAIKACPWLVPPSCGCEFGRCGKYDRPTSYPECLDCGEYA